MSSSDAIRKFERLVFKGDPTVLNPAGRNINRPVKTIDDKDCVLIGTYHYDFEKKTETYIPAKPTNANEN